MKIYFAGIIAGHSNFTSWREKEKEMWEKHLLSNRLCSYYFSKILEGYIDFRKSIDKDEGI